MIKVVYHKEYNRLSVTGHALSGEAGHDLVCASVSTLVYTLVLNVKNLVDLGQAREPIVEIKEGDATVWCKPTHRYKAVVTLIFNTICAGFDLLAKQHPDNISYEVRG